MALIKHHYKRYMLGISGGRRALRDLARVRRLAGKIRDIMGEREISPERLSDEELSDTDKMLQMAEYILCRQAEREATREMLAEMADILRHSAEEVSRLDDEILELAFRTEEMGRQIGELRGGVSERLSVGAPRQAGAAPD